MKDDYPVETRTREQLMEALKSDGMVGYDLSPGDPVARWAHKRILELEQTLRWIAGVDTPQNATFRACLQTAVGMQALALGALDLPDRAPDKNPVITGLKPDPSPVGTTLELIKRSNDIGRHIDDNEVYD